MLDDESVATPVFCRTDRLAYGDNVVRRLGNCRCKCVICRRIRIHGDCTREVRDQDWLYDTENVFERREREKLHINVLLTSGRRSDLRSFFL